MCGALMVFIFSILQGNEANTRIFLLPAALRQGPLTKQKKAFCLALCARPTLLAVARINK